MLHQRLHDPRGRTAQALAANGADRVHPQADQIGRRFGHRRERSKPRLGDRKSTRLNSSHYCAPRMPSSACKKKHDQYYTALHMTTTTPTTDNKTHNNTTN